jgi:hypothetical protein
MGLGVGISFFVLRSGPKHNVTPAKAGVHPEEPGLSLLAVLRTDLRMDPGSSPG